MDYRTITSLILRVAGALILIQLVIAVPHTLVNLLRFGGEATKALDIFVLTALSLIIPLTISLTLIYFPSVVTNHVIRPSNEGETTAVSEGLRSVAFSSLGMYFVCASLFDGVYWVTKLRIYYSFIDEQRWYGPPPALTPDDFAGIASTAFQLLFGLILLLGSRGISNVVARLRS